MHRRNPNALAQDQVLASYYDLGQPSGSYEQNHKSDRII